MQYEGEVKSSQHAFILLCIFLLLNAPCPSLLQKLISNLEVIFWKHRLFTATVIQAVPQRNSYKNPNLENGVYISPNRASTTYISSFLSTFVNLYIVQMKDDCLFCNQVPVRFFIHFVTIMTITNVLTCHKIQQVVIRGNLINFT